MRRYVLLVLLMMPFIAGAQELYVFSEPASNMPARSFSAKLIARYPDSKYNNYFKQRYVPEVMFGLSKKWMLHVGAGLSDYYSTQVRFESMKMYLKWRFLSNDEVHEHFRMAAFFEGAWSRNDFLYDEFSLDGDLSGFQTGVIATKLVNKLAVSGTLSFMKGLVSNTMHHNMADHHPLDMWNYSLSAGYLVFPREYNSYKQTNLNVYLELLGSQGVGHPHHYIDIAPAVQFIFNSTTKLDLGARFQLSGNMIRVGERTYQVGLEHTILNAFTKKNATQH